jgi:type VI protein secretion system component VasA
MREEGLKDYYEQELRYLRELGKEFAQQHGEIA